MVWYFKKDPKTGHTRVELQNENAIPVVPIAQPATTTLPGAVTYTKRFECTVPGCAKRFATQGVASIHYNRQHRQGDNKEEWRSYVKEIPVDDVNRV